jgi:acyl-CoA synthetase (AMP-forming)/AMP-acid ligase II
MTEPDVQLLLDRLAQRATQQPSKKLFSFLGPGLDGGRLQKSYTYEELAQSTSALAQRLLESGLKRGDR